MFKYIPSQQFQLGYVSAKPDCWIYSQIALQAPLHVEMSQLNHFRQTLAVGD